MLKTQLAIQVEGRSSSSANMGKNFEDWLQYNLLMIFNHLEIIGAAISDKYLMGCDILESQFITSLTKDNNDSTLRHLTFK